MDSVNACSHILRNAHTPLKMKHAFIKITINIPEHTLLGIKCHKKHEGNIPLKEIINIIYYRSKTSKAAESCYYK